VGLKFNQKNMYMKKIGFVGVIVALTVVHTFAAGKPLKVFIMAGQSNMQGMAKVRTIARLPLAEESKQMYQDMMVKDGMPSAVKDVYGVYFTGDDMTKGNPSPLSVSQGPLRPGYGKPIDEKTNFGPDYTFAIYMQKHLNEPFLIIKTAWGGRDLIHQFRPPSAGPWEKDKDRHGNPVGHYYNLTVKRVNEVLADPGKYHPAYNPADGYEIAGFVWFQGFNDLIGPYPQSGEKGPLDYSEYSRIMACFIRDIRKDLKAPQMPFVIGVMGIDGPTDDAQSNQYQFRKAQEAPASLPEFQGNVVAVRTEQFWDMELKRIMLKVADAAKAEVLAADPKKGGIALKRAAEMIARTVAPKVLTPEELAIYTTGSSNAPFHYMGSAYIYGNIGKSFAESMAKMMK
jgi:alpha-galactosidase